MGHVEYFSSCSHSPLAAVLSGERFVEGVELSAVDGRRTLFVDDAEVVAIVGACACQAQRPALDRRSGLCGLMGVVCLPFEIVRGFARDELARLGYLWRLLERPSGLELEFASPATRRIRGGARGAPPTHALSLPKLCLVRIIYLSQWLRVRRLCGRNRTPAI